MALTRVRILLLLAPLCVIAAAQDQPMTTQPGIPSPGAASVRVQVLTASHTFLPTQALVRLRDPREMHEAWDTTHDRSETVFYHLSPGVWEVEVSASGYRTAVTHVEVFDQPVQYTVQVILKPDPGTDVYKTPADNEITPKARKESQRGLADLQAGKTKDAEKHFREALKEAPQNAQINYLLGVVLLRGTHLSDAEQFFLQAISFDPRHAQALTTLGGLRLEEKDISSAVKFLQQAIAANPKQWRAHWLLANARLMEDQNEAAKSEAELAIQLSNDAAPAAHLVLGEALGNLGQYSEGVSALETYLQQEPASRDAPAVRKMISEMRDTMRSGTVAASAHGSAPEDLANLPIGRILPSISPLWQPPDVDSVLPPVANGVACPADQVIHGAGARVKELVAAIESFSADEIQTHEQVDAFGKPISREVRKSEYVAAISQPGKGQIGLQEFRRDLSGLGAFSDRITTRGLLTLAFVFHPAMQSDFRFNCEGLGEWKGQPAWLVHFRQLPDSVGRLQSFDLDQNSHPVALTGRAWIGAVDFQIVHIETDLVSPMPEVELISEHKIGDYGPVAFAAKKTQLWLPQDTQIYLELRGHRYRFSSHYTDFKLFSVDSLQKVAVPDSEKQ
ncbi:MAG: tetratricopeptide repeat protein [Acidobacteriaceae bacterium]